MRIIRSRTLAGIIVIAGWRQVYEQGPNGAIDVVLRNKFGCECGLNIVEMVIQKKMFVHFF